MLDYAKHFCDFARMDIALSMDTEALHLLLLVEEKGSLSAVAKQLDLAVSTVARRLEGLETALHLRLLDRRANGVRLTADGVRIAAMALPLIDQAARIARAAQALGAQGSQGIVTISSTEFVVSEILAPTLPLLWASNPKLAVTLRSQSEVVSLAARAADISIRMSRPEEPSLYARQIGQIPLGCYASGAYLAGRDPAKLLLEDERLLVYDETYGRIPERDWVTAQGLAGAVVLRSGSTRALLNSCAAGSGIALLPVRAAEQARLIAVKTPFGLQPRPVWLLAHRDTRRLPAIRAAQAWITKAFAARA